MDFDKENIKTLSNDQLFKVFKNYGIPCGPINQSTRSVYEKKLKNFLDGKDIDQSINTSIQKIQPKDQPITVLSASSIGNESPSSKSRTNRNAATETQKLQKNETEQINKRNNNVNEITSATISQNKPAILTGIFDNVSKNSIKDRNSEYTSNTNNITTTTTSTKNIPKEAYSQQPINTNSTNNRNIEYSSSSYSATSTTSTKIISKEANFQSSINSNSINNNNIRNNEYSSSYTNLPAKKMPTETYSQPLTLTSRVQSQDTITRSSSLQDKKTDLDFKLIKPSNTYGAASPPLTNSNIRREINNYGLLG